MYKVYDYFCSLCGETREILVTKKDIAKQICCTYPMKRMPATPMTTFKFNDKKLKR